ncbi:MAG: TspO/MBR family protein [Oscillospiraceae bacterium]
MKAKSTLKSTILWVIITLAVGSASSLFIKGASEIYTSMQRPAFAPPYYVFPIVWSAVYIIIGIAAGLIRSTGSPYRTPALVLYCLQLIVNFFWPIIFFRLRNCEFALVWLILLWIMVFSMLFDFKKINKLAGYLIIPYLLWLTFATYLNYFACALNK